MRRKQNLASAFGFQKRKLGLTMHFSEIIKLQFGKKSHTLLSILLFFRIIVASISLKNAWLPPILFLEVTMHFSEIIKLQFGKNRHT